MMYTFNRTPVFFVRNKSLKRFKKKTPSGFRGCYVAVGWAWNSTVPLSMEYTNPPS